MKDKFQKANTEGGVVYVVPLIQFEELLKDFENVTAKLFKMANNRDVVSTMRLVDGLVNKYNMGENVNGNA